MTTPLPVGAPRAAAPGRPEQSPTLGHEWASSWPTAGQPAYPSRGVQT